MHVTFCNRFLYEVLSRAVQDPWIAYEDLKLYLHPAEALASFFNAEGGVSGKVIRAENSNYELLRMIQSKSMREK